MNVRNAFSRFLLISAVLLTPLAAMAQALPARSPMIAVRDGGSAYVVTDVAGEASCRDATPEEAKIVNARSTVPMKIFGEDKGPIRTNATAGLNIVLRGTAQLDANPQAKAAFERAAEIWESQIANPVTVIVDVDFGPTRFGVAFPENVIASASSDSYRFSNGDYAEVRLLLIDRADNGNELSLYTALPATAIPADVNAGSVNNFVGPSILLRTLGVLPQFPPVATPIAFPTSASTPPFSMISIPPTGSRPSGRILREWSSTSSVTCSGSRPEWAAERSSIRTATPWSLHPRCSTSFVSVPASRWPASLSHSAF
jgi:hypothetical protein